MNLYAARNLAIAMLKEHGLSSWRFQFDHARRRFGSCRYRAKVITLSKTLAFLNDEGQVRDTILHEIAHVLAPEDGHGEKWKAMCLRVGAKPVRCYQDEEVVSPPRREARYQMGCGRCGWWADRFRLTRKKLVCRACREKVVFREKDLARNGA